MSGWVFNKIFVPVFNSLPRVLIRRLGWHLMIWAVK